MNYDGDVSDKLGALCTAAQMHQMTLVDIGNRSADARSLLQDILGLLRDRLPDPDVEVKGDPDARLHLRIARDRLANVRGADDLPDAALDAHRAILDALRCLGEHPGPPMAGPPPTMDHAEDALPYLAKSTTAAKTEAGILDGMCREYMEATGVPVERCMIVRETTDTGFRWYCAERPKDATIHFDAPPPGEEVRASEGAEDPVLPDKHWMTPDDGHTPGTIRHTRLGFFMWDGDTWCDMPRGKPTFATARRVEAALRGCVQPEAKTAYSHRVRTYLLGIGFTAEQADKLAPDFARLAEDMAAWGPTEADGRAIVNAVLDATSKGLAHTEVHEGGTGHILFRVDDALLQRMREYAAMAQDDTSPRPDPTRRW